MENQSSRKGKIMEFDRYLRKEQLSTHTVEVYVRAAKYLDCYLEGRIPEEAGLAEYRNYLLVRYRPSTVNLYLLAAYNFLRFCGWKGNRVRLIRIQARQSVENVLSLLEYQMLLSCAGAKKQKKDYLIIRTLASTGIRVSELESITAEALPEKKVEIFNKGKYREIYLPDKLLSELTLYCEEKHIVNGPVFLGNRNTSIDRRSVWEMLQKNAARCGIEKKKAHPHSLRHLFAKVYMESYGNLAELADILGHSSLETTRRYTMSSVKEKREKIEQLPF